MFIFKPEIIPSEIFLIGAGGTGSRLVPMMAQLVRTCIRKFNPSAWIEQLPIYIIDDDVVEEKNLMRQNFIKRDIGQSKASVLASRYSAAFEIPIYSSVTRIGNKSGQVENLFQVPFAGAPPSRFMNEGLLSSIVIMAVDSAEARRDILHSIGRSITDNSRIFVIDAGNEDDFGQVKFFTLTNFYGEKPVMDDLLNRIPRQCPVSEVVNFIPIDLQYYDSLGSSAQELSCADLPQTLAINSMMATLMLSVLQNLLYLKPMNYDGIRFALNGAVTSELNTASRWFDRVLDSSKLLLKTSQMKQFYERLVTQRVIHYANDPASKLVSQIDAFCKKNKMKVQNRELMPIPAPVLVPEKIPPLITETMPLETLKKSKKKALEANYDKIIIDELGDITR